jgi:adenylate cyclase
LFYLFEDFGLDTDRRELYRGAALIPVEPKVFDLLAYVIRNRERVVSKDDLIAAIWHGRIVSESALTTCINAARNAIGDSGEAQRLLKTLSRKGIRFIGHVDESEGKPPSMVPMDTASGPSHPSLAFPDKPTVAVLPFTNMSGDPEQEYFSDGITEDIITDLSKVSTLNVLSRNSTFAFKGKSVEIGEIAQRLKVGYVIEGSVRKAGGRVRITAQLIDASNDSHIWAERYDRDLNDIFALQDEMAQTIVAALRIRLLPEDREAIESRSTKDPKAYQLYLLARFYREHYFHPRPLKIALKFCRLALDIDPEYARAWALTALCEACLFMLGASEDPGLSAAERALSLDPTLAEAHAAKGLALNQLGESALAIAAHEESLRLDPDSYDVRANFAHTSMVLGNYETAIAHYERAAQLSENDYFSISLAASCHFALGHREECLSTSRQALARIEREIALRPDNQDAMIFGAGALGALGETERAKEWAMRALAIETDDDLRGSYNLACTFAQLEEPEHALDQLEKYTERMPPQRLAWVERDADLAPLRNHPRYKALVARVEARYSAFQADKAAKPKEGLNRTAADPGRSGAS